MDTNGGAGRLLSFMDESSSLQDYVAELEEQLSLTDILEGTKLGDRFYALQRFRSPEN